MNAIFSIHKDYIGLIFDGTKNLEFRKSIGKDLKENDIIFLYETKRDLGTGLIVGEVKIKKIVPIRFHKTGTYVMLPYFVSKYGTEEEKGQVEKAMSVHLTNFDESIVLSYLFDDWTLDYMTKNDDVPDWFKIKHPLWPNVTEYNRIHKKSADLCNRCDEWANKIGFYNKYSASYWKYIIELKEPIKYIRPLLINEFKNKDNMTIYKAPQSWCYTLNKGE